MAGPWEQYQAAPPESGPWEKFSIQPNPYASSLKAATPFKIGAEGLPDAAAESVLYTNPIVQMMHGAKAAAQNTLMRLKQNPTDPELNQFTGDNSKQTELSPQDQQQIQVNREILKQSPMALMGGIGTDMAMTAPIAGPVYSAVKSGASAVLPSVARFLAPSAGAGAAGALSAAATQPTLPGEGDPAAAGFVGGIFGDALLRGAGRAVQPITQSPAVQKLLSYNVVPSIGQAIGGAANRLEEKAMSVLGIGDVIKNARVRANTELNVAQLQKVDPAINVGGREGLQKAEDAVDTTYRTALDKIPEVMQGNFRTATKDIIEDPNRMLGEEQRKTVNNFVENRIYGAFDRNKGVISGEQAKEIDSQIGEAIKNAESNSVRNAMRDIQTQFRGILKDSAPNAEAAAALDAANRKYRDFMIAVRATGKPGAEGGNYTPNQLAQAVREGDISKNKRAYAKGTAYGQDLSDAAKTVLSDKVPNSGTADRALAALMLGGAGATASQNDVPGFNALGPAYWAALGASPLLYSRAGSRLLMGDLPGVGALQRGASGALNQMSPYAAQAGALYAPYR